MVTKIFFIDWSLIINRLIDIDCHRLISIFIDHRFHRLVTPGVYDGGHIIYVVTDLRSKLPSCQNREILYSRKMAPDFSRNLILAKLSENKVNYKEI